MNKTIIGLALGAYLLALSSPVKAQQPKRVPRIGIIDPTNSSTAVHRMNAFQQGLREFGYVDGTNISIEYRYTDGKSDRLSTLVDELVGIKVDIILASNNVVARSVSAITKTIPIVLLSGSDPVVGGLVASLARPGGNITGLTNLTLDLGSKRLELLKEIVPKLSRVAVLPSPGGAGQSLKELQAAAPALQLRLHVMEIHVADDLERAFTRAADARAGALIVTNDPTGIFLTNQEQILKLAAKNRLPAIYPQSTYVNAGGLVSYAADELENYRRAEQPRKFEFVINLKTAKQIGVTIPPNVLVRADRVIR